jgi:GT2 family glycosyltransferase
MRVAAGVLHYRNWPQVRVTLDALLGQSRPPDETFVLDHASGDGSAAQIRAAYPDVDVIEAPDNRGPIPGMNRVLHALLETGAEAILMLTHGSKLAPDALEHLARRLEEDQAVGAVGPVLAYLDRPERVHFAGGYVDRRTWHVELRNVPPMLADWRGRPPQEADWLDGGTLFMRAAAAREAGPLREEFYYHYDDCEYLLRVRSLGWRVECVPAAVAWSKPGSRSPYLEARNRLGFVAWSAPRRVLARELARAVYVVGRSAVRPRHPSERAEAWPRLRGLVDFCRGRWGRPPANLAAGRHG